MTERIDIFKKHLADKHKLIEAHDGMVYSDPDSIVYGSKASLEMVESLHEWDHQVPELRAWGSPHSSSDLSSLQ